MGNDAIFIGIVLLLLLLGLFVLPRLLIKRAVSKVISIFRRNNAIDAGSAKTLDELRLRPRTFMEGMFKVRDYKPYAMELLRNAQIIQMTEDDRLYLVEDRIASSRISITSQLGTFSWFRRR